MIKPAFASVIFKSAAISVKSATGVNSVVLKINAENVSKMIGNQEENFSYRVHDDITEIAENSFAYDAHLQTITIPATVTSIKSPFYNLTTNGIHGVFTSIVYEGSVEQWNEIDFHDMPLAPNTVIKDNAVTCLALDGGTSGSVTIQTDIE